MADVLSIINPATEALIQELAVDDRATVAEKYDRARQAQPGWAAQPLADRIQPILRFRELLIERADALAALLTSETGKPITQARSEILAVPGRLDFFVEHAANVLTPERVYAEPAAALPGMGRLEEVIAYDPLGVVANISAWNYPYFVGGNVFIPALLMGNAVLYKPSELATLTGRAIADLLHESGIPQDIFIPVIGSGLTGSALLEQPIDGVFFTGSYATGQKIAIAAAPKLVRTQLELGGKDPAYVCTDAKVAVAAAGLADGAFYNNGQSCCAVERIYVHTDVYDEFLTAFIETVRGFALGDPTDPKTYLGPVSRRPQLDVLADQVADALAKGATLRCGGKQLDRPGWYFAPTVLTEVNHTMTVMQAETFGPVIGIQRVASDAEAVALMQDTPYGLTAAVYGTERERAVGILRQLKTGSAYWNCCDRVSPRLPWSGRGHSGLGTTLSLAGLYTFLQPRAWHLRAG
ncbi:MULTISPECIES: aldehyde dehydrogenase family protein [Cyanophyceae]|uniref:aldehyde dehydrogenase family protein n=1 Tax=Cyanophyceae TaxID=3028117 RepID=UPI001682B121|nr:MULTISPECIES: aldehyde dehydrogenase family protein [Cyanophyceae]MBD1915485.1 aldehyde dehydrogenase family protein [Phormidium sp. FACHB-77]MBD2031795.1 aldehyde dehydrogenase family protein [Phormidium sp. FACHB-322]MBD2050545.1 aldehyde dehydrogenase family protein [Leptolyngbya sp. FACHB-60]